MSVVPSAEATIWSVSELVARLNSSFEQKFSRVRVRGEVSGYKGKHSSGHLYFAMKDESASFDVKVWKNLAGRLGFELREGMALVIDGEVSIWPAQGRISLIAHRVEPEGRGARAVAFEQLKSRLAEEGLIGPKRQRRPLPMLPKRIGVVTSRTAAALGDFLTVVKRRNKGLEVLVAHAKVQGEGAPEEIAAAFAALAKTDVEVIVVTRGGGSVDDLWTFNEELVARTIFAAKVPVISAVGHEIDVTLADLVADVRAPTPSVAAETVTPVVAELLDSNLQLAMRLRQAFRLGIERRRTTLRDFKSRLGDPRHKLHKEQMELGNFVDASAEALRKRLRVERERLTELAQKLNAARPQAHLRKSKDELRQLEGFLTKFGRGLVVEPRRVVAQLRLRLDRRTPRPLVAEGKRTVAELALHLRTSALARQATCAVELEALKNRLASLSPRAVLARGYALVEGSDGRLVLDAGAVSAGERVRVLMREEKSFEAVVAAPRSEQRKE